MITNNFARRHNGPQAQETTEMLKVLGTKSLDTLIDETIPVSIRLKKDLNLPNGISETEYLKHITEVASLNKVFKSYIGLGYYDTILPAVIQRNILENPGWYTSYTPYQAEISQGRLEALLNFQTMVCDLTGFPLANASLLDEGTAAAEAMLLAYGARSRQQVKDGVNVFIVAEDIFPQTLDVLKSRALPQNIELRIVPTGEIVFDSNVFGLMLQYPNQYGSVEDYSVLVKLAHDHQVVVAVACDLMSLSLLTPPAEWGADIAIGTTQRFGIPMGFGGPHAAFFATSETYKRSIPGRIIGVSVDAQGNRALRMALQTREQHIKRERATSNICTAQALLANMAGMYAVYHGPAGIKEIASDIHAMAASLAKAMKSLGFRLLNSHFFDTLSFEMPASLKHEVLRKALEEKEINIRYIDDSRIGISLDETKSMNDLQELLDIVGALLSKSAVIEKVETANACIPASLVRKSSYLQQAVFNKYHSETEMMRYIKKLEIKDLALNRAMIPLGSCTMKLNAVTELLPITWPQFANMHPFVPANQCLGYSTMIQNFEKDLCEITGFDAISFQPNSGAAGEYTGLVVIQAYHKSRGDAHRSICLIPASAHGTNPASAVMAGLEVVVVGTTPDGEIDLVDLNAKAELHKANLSCLMVTYPSTHGVFEESILEVVKIIHENGGQVYMDGANMNAQVGFTNPGFIGADVCHLNLHKTFAIPHGGGGPGIGPIGVAKHLTAFLPGHVFRTDTKATAVNAVAAAPYGSAMVLPISYGYVKLMGGDGLKLATQYAILNANYIKEKLSGHYKILYSGKNNRVAHELILDCNEFLKTAHIPVIDLAKRLMDYGFHAPTVAFPVHGTLMVEPTESEPKYEIDRFIEAMIAIREEIRAVEEGKASQEINVVNQAPHTLGMLTTEEWTRPYSRELAAFPSAHVKEDKYWPMVTKIDDGYGDRNLMCTCEPLSSYTK